VIPFLCFEAPLGSKGRSQSNLILSFCYWLIHFSEKKGYTITIGWGPLRKRKLALPRSLVLILTYITPYPPVK